MAAAESVHLPFFIPLCPAVFSAILYSFRSMEKFRIDGVTVIHHNAGNGINHDHSGKEKDKSRCISLLHLRMLLLHFITN